MGYAVKYVSGSDKGYRAVRWDASGTAATELGNLGTDSSGFTNRLRLAINTAGTAVGYCPQVRRRASTRAVAPCGGTPRARPPPSWGTSAPTAAASRTAFAFAINTAGTAVGYAYKYDAGIDKGGRAVRWDASGTAATELGNLGTSSIGTTTGSAACAINTAGTAVGVAGKYESGSSKGGRAVRWDASGTAATELGNLGTDSSGVAYSVADDINTAGTAVGYAEKYVSGSNKGHRAVRWDASGTAATELGNLGTDSSGFAFSDAYSINTAGIAVGYAQKYDSNGTFLNKRAVAWGLDGVAIDLNTLIDPGSGWVNLYEVRAISDTNWVTGLGTFDRGYGQAYNRMFLLNISSAVPEPTGLSLLALAVPALLRRRRRGGVVQGGVVSSSRGSSGTKQDASSPADPCASRQAGDDAFQSPHPSLVAAVLLLVLSPAAQAAAPDLFVASYFNTTLSRFDGTTGSLVYDRDVAYNIIDVAFGPDGNAYVSTLLASTVERIDPSTGADGHLRLRQRA